MNVSVEQFLSANIKEIIRQYPEAEQVLKDYDIACVDCNVGTCHLRDIIEIHALDPESERAVMGRLSRIVYPNQEVRIPVIGRKQRSATTRLSPPIEKLVQEHRLIKRLLHFIPPLVEELEANPWESRELIQAALDFIRTYADRFHHAKEEQVLFKNFDESAEIFQVMHRDHEQARRYLRQAQEALDRGDRETLGRQLLSYRELLQEHIKKEDEVLYPWIDRNLQISQVGQLYSRFAAIDGQFGEEPDRQRRYIQQLEEHFESSELDGAGAREPLES